MSIKKHPPYQNICCTFHNETMRKTIQPNSTTLLIKINLFFRQKVTNSTACTKTWKKGEKKRKKRIKCSCMSLIQSKFSNKLKHAINTHGSLFSCEPNMIIDFNAFQSCKTRSKASCANRGGSKSWSGISESKIQIKEDFNSFSRTEYSLPLSDMAYVNRFGDLREMKTCSDGYIVKYCYFYYIFF